MARLRKYEQVPKYVADQYPGGRRGFKATKRRDLRAAIKALEELRLGCACFPDGGSVHVEYAARALASIHKQINARRWGR